MNLKLITLPTLKEKGMFYVCPSRKEGIIYHGTVVSTGVYIIDITFQSNFLRMRQDKPKPHVTAGVAR
jgi:hypothetical protein